MTGVAPDWNAILLDNNAPAVARLAATILADARGERLFDTRGLTADSLLELREYLITAGYSVEHTGYMVRIKHDPLRLVEFSSLAADVVSDTAAVLSESFFVEPHLRATPPDGVLIGKHEYTWASYIELQPKSEPDRLFRIGFVYLVVASHPSFAAAWLDCEFDRGHLMEPVSTESPPGKSALAKMLNDAVADVRARLKASPSAP